MGWKISPPAFCTAMEMAANHANDLLQNNIQLPIHHLNEHAKIADSINPIMQESHSNEAT